MLLSIANCSLERDQNILLLYFMKFVISLKLSEEQRKKEKEMREQKILEEKLEKQKEKEQKEQQRKKEREEKGKQTKLENAERNKLTTNNRGVIFRGTKEAWKRGTRTAEEERARWKRLDNGYVYLYRFEYFNIWITLFWKHYKMFGGNVSPAIRILLVGNAFSWMNFHVFDGNLIFIFGRLQLLHLNCM